MRRISIWEVLGAFFIAAAFAYLAGGGIGLIGRVQAGNDIEAATSERDDLRIIEGGTGADPRHLGPATRSLRAMFERDPRMNVASALELAATLGNANPESLNRIVPSPRWAELAPLNDATARERLTMLEGRYHVTEALRNGGTPSEQVAIRAMPTYWTGTRMIGWYVAGCIAFLLIYGIRASFYANKHPILDAPWGSVPCLLAFAAAAPLTLPCLLAYGIWRLFTAEMTWREWWVAFARGTRVLGYRLRLLRRLPPPVIAPTETSPSPSRIVAPAPAPSPAMQETADGTDDEEAEEEEEVPIEWYVIHPDELLGREHLLAEAGVPVFPITIGAPEHLKGFAIEASRIEDFERALDLQDADSEDVDTDIDSTVRRDYDGECGEVAVSHVPTERFELVEKVLRIVSTNSEGVSIAFTHSGGRTAHATVSEDGWVEVFHCCSPTTEPQWTRFDRAYGAACLHGLAALKPSPLGGLVVKDADGNAVVQVMGRKVYVLCDLFGLDDDKLPSVLARALYDGVRAAEENPLDDDGDAAAWRSALDAERDAYVNLCLQNVDSRKEAIEREIKGHESEIRECGQRITVAVRKRHGAQQTLDRLVNDERAAEIGRLRKEFDQLAAAKPVLAVRAYADRIEVDTRTVYIPHMGRRYEIGRFRIAITDHGELTLANLSNTGHDTHCEHPHVRDRRPCLGNITEALSKLLGEREYALAVNLLFKFLESYNPSHPFSKIEHWKEVSR